MRVIAGSARGTRLVAPRGERTRPTADRVRESLFNIIRSRLDLNGVRVLDICAGTGALGIEALSRGAESCCFIEQDRQALVSIRRNLTAVHAIQRASLLEMDAQRALPLLAARSNRFDLVFFDPPYASDLYASVPEAVERLGLLEPEGLLVAECTARTLLPERIAGLHKVDRRVYGDTALELYALEAA